ncbi:MAG: IS3 family transposase [Nocardioidaceae bacterium]
MPKKIDPAVKERAVKLVLEHQAEYPSLYAAVSAVAKQQRLGVESLRRWVNQALVDKGDRRGATTEELAEIKELKAKVRRLEEDLEIATKASNFLRGGTRPPRPLIVEFIDSMRSEGHAVESTCRVLTELGCRVAARTYREWKTRPAAARTVAQAHVVDAIRDACWTVGMDGVRRLTPEGLYGRRKLTAYLRRTSLPDVSRTAVVTGMRILDHRGIRRGKGHRTTIPAKDGTRAGDRLNRDFAAAAPNAKWVMDFTYCRTWAGFVYVAFIVDCFAQRIVGWHAATTKTAELVLTPLRIALWDRDRAGRAPEPWQLTAHSDAGSQYVSVAFTEHLALEDIHPSIGTVGDAFDNALMETIIGLFKTECIRTTVFHSGAYKTIAEVEYATAGWVDWYNHRRLHSSLDMIPPVEYEQAHYAALIPEASPT